MMELNKQIIEVVESNGFSLGIITKHPHVVEDEQYYVEINQNTPEGEDWWETIWFDGTNEGFIRSVRSRATCFDVDEEAEVYIAGRGTNGVPNSIIALVNDAQWKESALEKLADDLENIGNEEEDKTNREELAEKFVNTIKEIASKPDNLDNLECYLSHHFDVWMEKFAYNPEGLVSELKHFAEMEI